MTDSLANSTWLKILSVLEEKLQYGLLEQAKSVVDVQLEGNELTLHVASEQAANFFLNDATQQRLIIQSRPEVKIDKIKVIRSFSSPIS